MSRQRNPRTYTTVSISLKLIEQIRLALPKTRYVAVSDFVRDAIRKRLEEIDREAPHP